jgi:Tfp pilus assembly protein PilO
MMGYLDRLNLKPVEKRLVVVSVIVVFVVLNAWFVFPHFSDLSEARKHREDAVEKLKKWESETNQIPIIQKRINELVKEGLDVPAEDQQNKFSSDILQQQAASGVNLINNGRTTTRTNSPFFVELLQTITVQSAEPQLVDFLYQLGNGPSLIRVRGLSMHPDPSHQQIVAGVTLVASYQKTQRARTTTAGQTAAAKKP